MRARTHTTTHMSYYKFKFLIRGKRPLSIEVVAISRDAARADLLQAYGEDVEIITVSCNYA